MESGEKEMEIGKKEIRNGERETQRAGGNSPLGRHWLRTGEEIENGEKEMEIGEKEIERKQKCCKMKMILFFCQRFFWLGGNPSGDLVAVGCGGLHRK